MLHWGFIGLGKIAHTFIKDMSLIDGHRVVAVGSRSLDRSRAFAVTYDIPVAYGSYEEIWSDPRVHIVYIATPHHNHAELSIAALQAGKHVLCEKPMGINRSEVDAMIHAARQNRKFLMEALWSRFNPTLKEVFKLIKDGAIGHVNYINADFTFKANADDESRLKNIHLAGGALLDVGIYPVFLAYMIFGNPKQIVAAARFFESGADAQTGAILKFDQAIANIMGGFISTSDAIARIYGTAGAIHIDARWHETQGYTIQLEGDSRHVTIPKIGKGYTYEMEECASCISSNQIESSFWTHQNSLDLAAIMDEIRQQIGLRYPMES